MGDSNNPTDFPDCQCDKVPQLDALFQTINGGDKQAVQQAINMTSIFVYQASVVLGDNTDTGGHNYYMTKQPNQPWRIVNADPDCETVQTSSVFINCHRCT